MWDVASVYILTQLLLFQLHLKFCYESVLKHVKQVLQRHGVTAPSSSKPASCAAQKVGLRAWVAAASRR